MKQKLTILVTGATGAQGGSVARALLEGGKFAVRALTRNASSTQAQELARAGAEVVEGTMDDIESLKRAMKGCYGVFGVTNFWEHFEKEYRHGKNLIDAVDQTDIKHFVFSSLANYHKISKGTLSVPHYDIKAALEDYTKQLQIPATFVRMAFYYENFINFFPLQKDEDGGYYFAFPQDNNLAAVSVEDLGGVVASIFDHPYEYKGRVVGVVGENRPSAQYAATMSKVLGKKVSYKYIPRDVFAGFGFPGAEDLANMFEVQRSYVPDQQLDLIESYGLNPKMQTFENWLIKNKSKFNLPVEEDVAVVTT